MARDYPRYIQALIDFPGLFSILADEATRNSWSGINLLPTREVHTEFLMQPCGTIGVHSRHPDLKVRIYVHAVEGKIEDRVEEIGVVYDWKKPQNSHSPLAIEIRERFEPHCWIRAIFVARFFKNNGAVEKIRPYWVRDHQNIQLIVLRAVSLIQAKKEGE